jgi:hypothetical protein
MSIWNFISIYSESMISKLTWDLSKFLYFLKMVVICWVHWYGIWTNRICNVEYEVWNITVMTIEELVHATRSDGPHLPSTFLATSTAVECVFSQGRQLLNFTQNALTGTSICMHLCLGSWCRNDIITAKDLLVAIKEAKKVASDAMNL